jgi:hypothetical protein
MDFERRAANADERISTTQQVRSLTGVVRELPRWHARGGSRCRLRCHGSLPVARAIGTAGNVSSMGTVCRLPIYAL